MSRVDAPLEYTLTQKDAFLHMEVVRNHISRRLQATPAWTDILVIILLCLMLFLLLKFLLGLSKKWQDMMLNRVKKAIALRKNTRDNFRTDNGYSWDYTMVFKVYLNDADLSEYQKIYSLKYILSEFAEGGLETRLFYSVQADEVYCKIRAPIDRLNKEADRINMKLKLDSDALRAQCKQGRMEGKTVLWDPVDIPDISEQTDMDPYDHIYARYEHNRADVAKLYKIWPNKTHFRGVDRLKLIQSIISARKYDGGCHLDVYKLIENKSILAFYPLHDHVELRELESRWLNLCQLPWYQPVDDVKDYFGEKIGLYFLWLGHYTSWLMVAGVVGFFAWINIAANDNDPNAEVMPYFAAFMAIWSTLFLEYWKRKEKKHALKWGMVGYEEEEQTRPQFNGTKQPSPVDGREQLYFPRSEAQRRAFQSSVIIVGFILIVIAVVGSIFILKLVLSQIQALTVGGTQMGSIIASICNAIQIQVMNMIYGGIAIQLNDYENHRTDTEYEDALIAKTFVFQFVNSFASLFYIAFVKPFISDLDPCIGSCMGELQANLGTIFLTRLAVGNLTEVLVPTITTKLKEKSEMKGATMELSEVERSFILAEYHVMLGPFGDYAEMAIQFGYATMFVAAFPLAAIMSFVNNYIEIRVDAWKLCQCCRRAEPRSCEDIGTWMSILEIISFIAVIVNSGLVAFTGTYALDYTWAIRVWIFISMAAGIIGVNTIFAFIVPDVPAEVEIQIKRQDYIVGKVLDNIKDEDDEDLLKDIKANLDYTIRITDDDPL